MSAAARGAAGYLFASGRLRATKQQKAERAAERAAEELKRARGQKPISTAVKAARRS